MVLWAMCAAAQPPQHLQTRVFDDNCYFTPNPNSSVAKCSTTSKLQFNFSSTSRTTKPKLTTPRKKQASEDEITYQVDFVLNFNADQQIAKEILIINNDTQISNIDQQIWSLEQGSNILSIPRGTYDIAVTFQELDTTKPYEFPLHNMTCIRELVDIDGDTMLHFASSEAKNHIHFQTLTIDGDQSRTDKYQIDDSGNLVLVERGNIDDIISQSILFCKDYGTISNLVSNFGIQVIEDNSQSDNCGILSDFFVNDVSNRFTFYCYRMAYSGNDIYTSTYETHGAQGDITITNDPSSFDLFEDQFLVPQKKDVELYRSCIMYVKNPVSEFEGWQSFTLNSPSPLLKGETLRYWLSGSPDDSEVDMCPLLQPMVATKSTVAYPWGEEEEFVPVLVGMPLTASGEKCVIANNGVGNYDGIFEGPNFNCEFSNNSGDDLDVKFYQCWPTHPQFTYPTDLKIGGLGNNCPVLVSNPHQYETIIEWADNNGNPVTMIVRKMKLDFDYIGRYGEKRPDDQIEAVYEVKFNGESFASGQGPYTNNELSELLNGIVDATIVKEGIVVDDIVGSNKAKLHYTAGADDQNPPTMTMLHFKDSNGDVTDRFATADDGTLEFSAGDFNFMLTPMGYSAYNRFAPETVEVSYSPYGEDNWNELVVEEVPENYWPVMGWFYTGSLAGVTGQGLNGWFDLKIRLVDAAGNWQEQVLSPAFCIDDLAYSSVANVGKDNAHEVARYNLAGQRVDSNHRGVTIIKMSDGTAKKIVQ